MAEELGRNPNHCFIISVQLSDILEFLPAGFVKPKESLELNRAILLKASEVELCAKNGVTAITEVMIGYDGIVLAHSKKGVGMPLTPPFDDPCPTSLAVEVEPKR